MYPFDLHQLAHFHADKPHIQVIARSGHARQILFAFRAGQGLREHTTSSQIAVQVISGQLCFTAAHESSTVTPGQLLLLEGDIPHSVYAESDTIMLLTMTPDPQHHSLSAELFDKIEPLVNLIV
ncbi:MAG: cupin domain-containing protein [Caldilineaceae bacterium]|nr:cupin domain-containing protein [Caldilineaceae bacterium]